jgi:hypothetical protein
MTRATVDGLKRLVRPEDVAALRGKTIAEVLPVSTKTDGAEVEATEADEALPVEPEATTEPAEEVAE